MRMPPLSRLSIVIQRAGGVACVCTHLGGGCLRGKALGTGLWEGFLLWLLALPAMLCGWLRLFLLLTGFCRFTQRLITAVLL